MQYFIARPKDMQKKEQETEENEDRYFTGKS